MSDHLPPPSRPVRAHVPPLPPPPATPLRAPPPGGAGASPGLKRVIYTGAFAAVTIVGAIYGAGLKTQEEFKAVRRLLPSLRKWPKEKLTDSLTFPPSGPDDVEQEKTKIIEATPEQRIAQLEARRSALVSQRIPIQRKLDEVQERIRVAEDKEQQQKRR